VYVVREAFGLTIHVVCLYFGRDPRGLETDRQKPLTSRPGGAIRFAVFVSRVGLLVGLERETLSGVMDEIEEPDARNDESDAKHSDASCGTFGKS